MGSGHIERVDMMRAGRETCPFLVVLRVKSSSMLFWEDKLVVRHHHDGLIYMIEVPEGSRLRRSEDAGEAVIFVPVEGGGEVPIFEVPGELLVQLAQAGRYGMRLLGIERVPET